MFCRRLVYTEKEKEARPEKMRRKLRFVITSLVLLWLMVSVIYLFPFLFASKADPSFVSSSLAKIFSSSRVLLCTASLLQ